MKCKITKWFMEENMEILKVENLTKSYGKGEAKVDAIKNINLSINKGCSS